MTRFSEAGIGVSVAVSMGNKAMVDEVRLVRHFAEREDTKAACFYIEGLGPRTRDFVEAAGLMAEVKPVIVYLGAKSDRGQRAALSHTAAMAGNLEILSGALRQKGIIEAENEAEITSFCKIFSYYHHRPLRRGRMAVITSSGGHGVIAADLLEKAGLNMVEFPEDAKRAIEALVEEHIRNIACFDNPVDLTGSASDQDFERALDFLLSREDVEAVMVLALPYTPMITSFVGTRLGQVVRRYDKPVVAYVPDLAKFGMVLEGFELNGIPVVHSIEEAVQMFKALRLLGLYGDGRRENKKSRGSGYNV